MSARLSALERCVGDAATLAEAWGRRPFRHRSAEPAGFADLLSAADVDRLLASSGLRTPAFRLVRDGRPLDPAAHTRSGRIGGILVHGLADPAKVLAAVEGGATLVLQAVHRYWPPVAAFCRDLEWALGHRTQVNAYVTPAGARGLAVHEDAHDVFVMQAFGRKHWQVWPTGCGVDEARAGIVLPALAAVLEPGDVLYLPQGTPHAADAQEVASGHLTVGIHPTRWIDVIEPALAALGRERDLEERLPIGFHHDEEAFAAAAEDRLKSTRGFVERLDANDVAAAHVRAFLTGRPPLLAGAFQDLLALADLRDDSPVRRRPGSICVLQDDGDALRVLLGDRELRMPARIRPAMEALADRSELRAADLAGLLDEPGRLTLVRRLVREGMFEVARER